MGTATKVLFIVNGFPPNQQSGTFRSEAFARYLPDFGVYPMVICAADADCLVAQYGAKLQWQDDPRWPEVRRIEWGLDSAPKPMGHVGAILRRMPIGWTLALRRGREATMARILPTARETIARHRPSVIYASSIPVECCLIADRLGQEFGLPVVQDFRDIWSYGWQVSYRHYVDFLLERSLERRVLARAAMVIANTPTARSLLLSKIGLAPERVTTVPNGYDERTFENASGAIFPDDGKFRIAHLGLLTTPPVVGGLRRFVKRSLGFSYRPIQSDSSTRSASWFLKAIEKLFDEQEALRSAIQVVFVGKFNAEDERVFRSFRYPDSLSVVPPVVHADAVRMCYQADLLLLLQVEMKLGGADFCTAVPGKIYDYLRSGTRILGLLQPGDAREMIECCGAGLAVPAKDTSQIGRAVCEEFRDWRARGSKSVKRFHCDVTKYEYRRLAEQMAGILACAAIGDPDGKHLFGKEGVG